MIRLLVFKNAATLLELEHPDDEALEAAIEGLPDRIRLSLPALWSEFESVRVRGRRVK